MTGFACDETLREKRSSNDVLAGMRCYAAQRCSLLSPFWLGVRAVAEHHGQGPAGQDVGAAAAPLGLDPGQHGGGAVVAAVADLRRAVPGADGH